MEGILEYIDINYNKEYLTELFNSVSGYEPLNYIECGASSHVLITDSSYYDMWEGPLEEYCGVHQNLCEHGTGFNFSPTTKHNVPPHIDIGNIPGNQFNLLLPLFGTATISIYKTIPSQLEFRHGKTHWNMLQNKYPPQKIGSILVDKPVLLNTDYLHDVQVVDAPRAIFCIAWRGVNRTYNEFKKHAEKTLA